MFPKTLTFMVPLLLACYQVTTWELLAAAVEGFGE